MNISLSTETLNGRLNRNGLRKCAECGAPRSGFSKFCDRCKGKLYRWGHAYGRGITREDYSHELKQVQKAIRQNLDKHEGLQKAVEAMDRLLKLSPLLKNHQAHGVDGAALLANMAAVYAFNKDNHRARPFMGSWTALYTQLGHAAVNMVAKKYRAAWATPPKKRDLGWAVYGSVRPMLANLAATVVKMDEANSKLQAAMEAPLECF